MAALVGASIAGTGRAQTPPTEWSFGLGLMESRELDRTVNGTPAEDRILDNANLRFGYATVREHSRVSLFARAGTSIAREPREENLQDRIDFGFGFGWSQQVTERFHSDLSVNLSRDFARPTLSDLGVIAPDLRGYSANASWGTSYRSSPRTTWSTSVDYQFREIRNSRVIPGSQVVLDTQPFGDDLTVPVDDPGDGQLLVPDAETDILDILATEGLATTFARTHFASAGLSYIRQLTQYTSLGFDVAAGYRTFDRDPAPGLGPRRDGSEAAGRLYIQRAVGSQTFLSTAYELRRSIVLEPATTIQSLFGGLSTSGREREIAFTLFGGVSYYDAENAVSRLTPVANVSLSGSLTHSTTASIAYRRQFSNAIGFGRPLLIDYAGANLTQELGARASFRLSAGASFSTDPLALDRDSSAKRAGGAFTLRIVGGLSAGTSFFWTETDFSSELGVTATTEQKLLSFYLTFGTTWH